MMKPTSPKQNKVLRILVVFVAIISMSVLNHPSSSFFVTASTRVQPSTTAVRVTTGDDTKILGGGGGGTTPKQHYYDHYGGGNGGSAATATSSTLLPLGVPVEFESPLFKGTILLRFRNAKSEHPPSHEEYFSGTKRLMQTVIQGRFKKSIPMNDIYVGSVFAKPFPKGPPPSWVKVMDAVVRRVAPGLIMDLSSNQPKIIALYGGTAQTLSIDKPGSEPDIMSANLPERVKNYLGTTFSSAEKRKKKLSIPEKASQYVFDTDHVYTFHNYDDAVDYSKGTIRLPVYGDYDIKPAVGDQPLSLCAVTSNGETMYNFQIKTTY